LLLPSQIQIMKEVFEKYDKYNDQILNRSHFLMQLRTDQLVVEFIDTDAVKVVSQKNKILTMDQVLIEVEKDEFYDL
jgi:hypothetical protein